MTAFGLGEPEPDVDHLLVALVDGDAELVHNVGQGAVVECFSVVAAHYAEPGFGVVVEAGHEIVGDVGVVLVGVVSENGSVVGDLVGGSVGEVDEGGVVAVGEAHGGVCGTVLVGGHAAHRACAAERGESEEFHLHHYIGSFIDYGLLDGAQRLRNVEVDRAEIKFLYAGRNVAAGIFGTGDHFALGVDGAALPGVAPADYAVVAGVQPEVGALSGGKLLLGDFLGLAEPA